jgi:hypothetical protein
MAAPSPETSKFTIGADPEWGGLTPEGRLLFFGREFCGAVRRNDRQIGQLTIDHNGWVAELQPLQTYTARGLVRRIGHLIQAAAKKKTVPAATGKWLGSPFIRDLNGGRNAARQYVTCGGHVHISENAPVLAARMRDTYTWALGKWAQYLEALNLWDPGELATRSSRAGYGFKDDAQFHRKSLPTLEYRAFGTWLGSPWLALTVLTGCHALASQPDLINDLSSQPSATGLRDWFQQIGSKDAQLCIAQMPAILKPATDDIRERWSTEAMRPFDRAIK